MTASKPSSIRMEFEDNGKLAVLTGEHNANLAQRARARSHPRQFRQQHHNFGSRAGGKKPAVLLRISTSAWTRRTDRFLQTAR